MHGWEGLLGRAKKTFGCLLQRDWGFLRLYSDCIVISEGSHITIFKNSYFCIRVINSIFLCLIQDLSKFDDDHSKALDLKLHPNLSFCKYEGYGYDDAGNIQI